MIYSQGLQMFNDKTILITGGTGSDWRANIC